MLPVFVSNRVYALILYAAFLVWIVPEVIRSFAHRVNRDSRTNDRFSGIFLFACIWIGIQSAYILAYKLPGFAIPWHRMLLFGAGIFLMLAGVVFRAYSIRVLGKYFTTVVAIQPGQTVTRTGPYRYIRHPSYSGALLTILGIGLAIGNWLGLIAVLFFGALGYGYRIIVEEKALIAALGEPYREYMRHTKRIIPFVI
jgi:protein-S-isoprenylcysteine O-methyltransferase Ste14